MLKVGDTAPDFPLLSDEWKTVKLSDYRGKKNVFLAVYVLAFTGGWTQQLQAVHAGIAPRKNYTPDTEGFGVSLDSPPANAALAKPIGPTLPPLHDLSHQTLST